MTGGTDVLGVGCKPPAQRFDIPRGAKPSCCRSCGARVYWIRTAAGKLMPVEPDGTSHFIGCPQANAWRKRE